MPIQMLNGTILISQFSRPIMFLTPTPRLISPRWSFSLNSSLRKLLTHSVTQRTHGHHKQKTFASRMIPMFLDQIVANYVLMQRLTRGLSFASTPSPYLYANDLQDSSTGIAAARPLPRALTTSKNRISLPTFSGIMHISIIASVDTTLPSYQPRRWISSRSSMSKNVCETTIFPIVNYGFGPQRPGS